MTPVFTEPDAGATRRAVGMAPPVRLGSGTYGPMRRHSTLARNGSAGQRRLVSWTLIAALAGFTSGCVVLRHAGLLRVAFPIGACAVALWLLRATERPLYFGFTLWLWFLTPGLRRMVDYQVGWDPQNPIVLAPLLVSGLSLVGVLHHLPKLQRVALVPFALLLGGIVYGYAVGIVRADLSAATYGFMNWAAPVGLGAFLALNWPEYPAIRSVVSASFLWGVLLLGAYGLMQFVAPPPWDAYWMLNSGMNSIGQPLPYHVRVFSLLNSPLPFAAMMGAGLFMLLTRGWGVALLAAVLGLASLLLSLVRSAWLACAIGLVVYAVSAPWSARRRLALACIAVCAALPVAAMIATEIIDPTTTRESVERRFETLTDLSEDVSLADRRAFTERILEEIAADPIGKGLGATGGASTLATGNAARRTFDNGILDIFYSLGWFGGACFAAGFAALVITALRGGTRVQDPDIGAVRAAAVATAALAFSGPIFGGVIAALLWSLFGLVVAARAWSWRSEVATGPARPDWPRPTTTLAVLPR